MSLTTFDTNTLRGFTHAFEELFYAGDAATMASYYTDDGQIMADGMRPIRGRAAIEGFWQAAIERVKTVGARRAIELHEWSGSAEMGYALCTVAVELPTTTVAVWDTTVWCRGADGRWRIAVDISTPLPPAGPAAPGSP